MRNPLNWKDEDDGIAARDRRKSLHSTPLPRVTLAPIATFMQNKTPWLTKEGSESLPTSQTECFIIRKRSEHEIARWLNFASFLLPYSALKNYYSLSKYLHQGIGPQFACIKSAADA